MESSRVFVRGLPPTITTEEVMQHFSKDMAVTDVKVIPSRRIGYVGYQTASDAAKAVKYHNKSFIRMSRIGVELARSPNEIVSLHAQVAHKDNESISTIPPANDVRNNDGSGHKKRKLGSQRDSKFEEFLDVMRPPTKAIKITDTADTNKRNGLHSNVYSNEQLVEEGHSDGEYVTVSERDHGRKEAMIHDATVGPQVGLVVEAHNSPTDVHTLLQGNPSQNMTEQTKPAASDQDWLRSRTSRTLDLAHEKDEVGAQALDVRTVPTAAGASIPPSDHAMPRTSNTGTQVDGIHSPLAISEESSPRQNQKDFHTGRLFIRNLSYTTGENELRELFDSKKFGLIEEASLKKPHIFMLTGDFCDEYPDRDNLCYAHEVTRKMILVHMPRDHKSGRGKGYAYVQYKEPFAADHALGELDGTAFQGRFLHVMTASSKMNDERNEFTFSQLPLKKQQQIKRKTEAASSTFNWNSMFMNADAVMSSISERLGIAKSDLLDPTSSDAAVKQAHAETYVIQETKEYFAANGVDLAAFQEKDRGDTILLVKNFPYDLKAGDLQNLFGAYGGISKLLVPPSGTIAIIVFHEADHARSAFKGLAYRKIKESILFLEKAPRGLFPEGAPQTPQKAAKVPATEIMERGDDLVSGDVSTLFIQNLNFATTTDRLRETFKPIDGFLSARVKTKTNPKRPGQVLSMGFGFLEFRTTQQAKAALAAMDGYNLDGHRLQIKMSLKKISATAERQRDDQVKKASGQTTKIIIKNLPFEASKHDVRSLFGPYGQLRSVRVPKKFNMSTRGFAFADFLTPREAENAMRALQDTHLLGRRLVLQYAVEEAIDPEREIADMQKKVGSQADKVALQHLTGTGRKKFNAAEAEDSG